MEMGGMCKFSCQGRFAHILPRVRSPQPRPRMPPFGEGDALVRDITARLHPDIRRQYLLQSLRDMLHVDEAKLEKFLIVAVLITLFTDHMDLALLYLMAQRPAQSSHSAMSLEASFLAVWDQLLDDDTFALHCLVELVLPAGPLMLIADRFAMEHILVGRIMEAASRGVTMALDQVIEQFLGLWLSRTHCGPLEAWLTNLAHHQNIRRKFGVHLRSVWNLQWGSLRTITSVDQDTARHKAT